MSPWIVNVYNLELGMPAKQYTRESIIVILQNLAKQKQIGSLTKKDINQVISTSTVNRNFGTITAALEAAGLSANPPHGIRNNGPLLTENDLFSSLLAAEKIVGHEPTANEYSAHGSYSVAPFKKRFGKWEDTLSFYRKWKNEQSELLESEQVNYLPETDQPKFSVNSPLKMAQQGRPPQLYGEPIDFRGLRHAPINEQGVVYLFGMVSRELGFYVEAIQQGFPDCEGKYLFDKNKNLWAKARIEFEYRATSFQQHGHDINQCDFIVCWINDWPECPITVIELKKEIMKLPSS